MPCYTGYVYLCLKDMSRHGAVIIHLQQYIYSSLEESKENSNNKPKEIEQERK